MPNTLLTGRNTASSSYINTGNTSRAKKSQPEKRKNTIVKVWECTSCSREYSEKPVVCTGCYCLMFNLKYTGEIVDNDELGKLIKCCG